MCFSDTYNREHESRRSATAATRQAQGYGRQDQYAMGGYSHPQSSGGSYAWPGHPYNHPPNDPRAAWGQQRTQQPSQPRPYAQPYGQQYSQNHSQQFAQQYDRREGQQKFRPYRPTRPEEANVKKVPVSRPRVDPGYAQERHYSIHGEIVYAQPSQVPAPTYYPGTSQRETSVSQPQVSLKPASRPMGPAVYPSRSRPGRLVRRDSNGVSECSDDDYRVDLRDYTVSPDIARGRPNRPRRPSKQ